jgi:menaquinone-dependent protoporphyrinogen oxidase
MKPVLIFYATREGQSEAVAEYLADVVKEEGMECMLSNVSHFPSGFPPGGFGIAFLVASVHGGRHEPEMTAFVKKYRSELEKMPAVFLSLSLSQVTVEKKGAPLDARRKAEADVSGMIQAFFRETGWKPSTVQPVAGALRFSRYGFFLRLLMKWISWRSGGPTDTSRDYVFTNWYVLHALTIRELKTAFPEHYGGLLAMQIAEGGKS